MLPPRFIKQHASGTRVAVMSQGIPANYQILNARGVEL